MKRSTLEKKVKKFGKAEFHSNCILPTNTVVRGNKAEEKYRVVYSYYLKSKEIKH